jgi:hypothetical protein
MGGHRENLPNEVTLRCGCLKIVWKEIGHHRLVMADMLRPFWLLICDLFKSNAAFRTKISFRQQGSLVNAVARRALVTASMLKRRVIHSIAQCFWA